MKKLIKYLIISNVIITLLMLPLAASSQKLDSLRSVWNDEGRDDSLRLDALWRYTSRRTLKCSHDSLFLMGKQMFDVATENENLHYQSYGLNLQGMAKLFSGEYSESKQLFLQKLEIDSIRGSTWWVAINYSLLGEISMHLYCYQEGLDYLNKSLKIWNERGDTTKIAFVNNVIGVLYQFQGNYNKAISYFIKSLDLSQASGDLTWAAVYRANIATVYADQGDYKKAYPILNETTLYFEKNNITNLKAQYCNELGQVLSKLGRYNEADKYYQKSINYFKKVHIPDAVARSLISRGNNYLEQSVYSKALELYDQGLKAFEKIDRKDGIAECYSRLGNLNYHLDDYTQCIYYHNKSLSLYKEIGYKANIADQYNYLGETYNEQQKYDSALIYFNKSLDINFEIGRNNSIADNFRYLGVTCKEQGMDHKALDYFQKCMLLKEKSGDIKGQAEIYKDIGNLKIDQNEIMEGLNWCQKSYDIAVEIGVLKLEQEAAYCLYKANKKLGHDNPALNFLERSLALKDSLQTDDAYRQLQQMEFERQHLADSLAMVAEKLKTDLVYQDSLSQERNTRNIFIFVGLGILLLAVGIFSRMLYVRRTNKELERRNEIISKEKERAEASEKAKEQFFNNISHEFRTPLTLILGPLNETLEKTSDDRIKPGLQIMQRNALRLQEMINELLDLSKLEFGKVKLQAKEENIVKLTEDYLQSFESLADQRRIKLKFKSDAKEYKAWIDSEKFEKILANLLSNAFKYTNPKDEIRVNISSQLSRVSNISGESSLNKGVYITVSDSGIGIAKENLPHIFDRFFQVGEPSPAHHAGTGIGLALTKELVELHHGSINVISEAGKGTTFTVFIPFGQEHFAEEEIFVEVTKEKEAEKTVWAVDKDISGHMTEEEVKKKNELPNILIIEDNADMRDYIKTHLEKAYTILEASDGEAGLQAAIDNIPDLIISDVMMPKMDGHEMTEKLKTDPRTSHIPVIILTARASVESKIEGLETGADAYVTKPFNARELQVRVKKLIEQREKLREHFSRTLESLDTYLVNDPQLPSMDRQFVRKAVDVVKEHMADDVFNASTFAREMALSRVQLHRKIKALTNKTTTEFIRIIRLNHAARLLKGQTGNVTEIAYEVGFSSLSYFTRSFTDQFGSTPSAFAQKYKTRKGNPNT